MHPVLLWFTTFVLGGAIGLGTGFAPFLVVAAVPVLSLVAASHATRVGLSGFLLGFGGIWFVLINRVRDECARGEASGCYSGAEEFWFTAAIGSLAVAAVLLAWAVGSRIVGDRRAGVRPM